jgi:hypothetical protein
MTSAGYALYQLNLYGLESYAAIWVGPHDVCTVGQKLLKESELCVTSVCVSNPDCCEYVWSAGCVADATSLCALC